MGKATAPLMAMIGELPDDKKNMPYKLYTDNLFTSPTLLRDMRDLGTERKKIGQVPRPSVIGKYNGAMGGTDLMD
ncbi:hypothetical protein NQ315_000489 [Exocentrus adspersus]|uniref:PiggyBac transposable element-derived protein domain-containing protein n=1 Tax=Exocentrus adspersus TaxID=1586481 RepID=A0AAV8VF89_9CUCU|nr:hypothetical protein NQ315_000489 [Exocentrus adspersus]